MKTVSFMKGGPRLGLFFICLFAWGTSHAAQGVLDTQATIVASPERRVLLAVAAPDGRVVAAGEMGIVVTSTDGGKSWQQAKVPVGVSLTNLRFTSAKTGWAVGHAGVLLKTEDGGNTWTKLLDGEGAAKLAFEKARVLNDPVAMNRATKRVAEGADKPFFDILFLDDKRGFLVGAYGLLLRTVNAGKTWESWAHKVPEALADRHLHQLIVARDTLFIAGEQGTILRSKDGGESFEALPSPYKGTFLGGVATKDGEVVLYGLRGNAYLSADLGLKWSKLALPTTASITAALQLKDGRLILASQAGEILVPKAQQGYEAMGLQGSFPYVAIAASADEKQLYAVGLGGARTIALSAPGGK